MAKVLVTGAGGKIGRALTPELVARGHEVIGLYRSRIVEETGAVWHQADIARPETYVQLLHGCDAVIHLAVEFQPKLMDAINVKATVDLQSAAHAAGVRYFGFASSIVVYGSPPRSDVTEETPVIDLTRPIIGQYLAKPLMLDYARTKIEAERALMANAAGMTIDLYRPTVVTNLDGLLEVGNWSVGRKARSANRFTQYVTTIDVAAAIRHLMEHGLSVAVRNSAEAFNIADDASGTYAQLLARALLATRENRFRVAVCFPPVVDRIKEIVTYRNLSPRTSLGRLRVSTAKLRATGFEYPLGMDRALYRALCQFNEE